MNYNYNLQCNVKRKARPLILNVKGEGYQIHHSVMADEPQIKATSSEPTKLHFGDIFINEIKTKKVELTNNGEFNFDFMWKRVANKFITISPENGTVMKGSTVEVII
jgi:hydrocephalus-inducing protein